MLKFIEIPATQPLPQMTSAAFIGNPVGGANNGIFTFRGTLLGTPNIEAELVPNSVASSNHILQSLQQNDSILIHYQIILPMTSDVYMFCL